jgi:hypothetical protein
MCPFLFNSYLFTRKFNSSEANYKVNTSKEEETTTKHKQNIKRGSLYSNSNNNHNDNNSIKFQHYQ